MHKDNSVEFLLYTTTQRAICLTTIKSLFPQNLGGLAFHSVLMMSAASQVEKTGICSLWEILIEINIHFKEKEERLWGKINFLGSKNSWKDKERAFTIFRVSVSPTLPPKGTCVSLLFFPSPPSQVNMTPNIIWMFIKSIIHTMFPRAAGTLGTCCPELVSAGFPPTGMSAQDIQVNPSDGRKSPWVTADEVGLDIRGNFSMERVVKPWNRLPGAALESLGTLGDWWAWQCFGEWLTGWV